MFRLNAFKENGIHLFTRNGVTIGLSEDNLWLEHDAVGGSDLLGPGPIILSWYLLRPGVYSLWIGDSDRSIEYTNESGICIDQLSCLCNWFVNCAQDFRFVLMVEAGEY